MNPTELKWLIRIILRRKECRLSSLTFKKCVSELQKRRSLTVGILTQINCSMSQARYEKFVGSSTTPILVSRIRYSNMKEKSNYYRILTSNYSSVINLNSPTSISEVYNKL